MQRFKSSLVAFLLMTFSFILFGCGAKTSGSAEAGPAGSASLAGAVQGGARNAPGKPHTVFYLQRVTEPNERAFSVLVPRNWGTKGGILRINPLTTNGVANTVGAKVDFMVRKDERGTILLHWLPNFNYKDMSQVPNSYGFPNGSMYMGMRVAPLMNAVTFLQQAVFPNGHPRARNVKVVDQRPLPRLAQKYRTKAPCMAGMGCYTYDAATVAVTYEEDGVRYKERMVTTIEDTGRLALGMWANKETFVVRAPEAEFDGMVPLFALIENSFQVDPAWLSAENRGADQRARMALQHQRDMQQEAQEIVDNRRRVNAEIANDAYLNLTNQEEYVNPYTNQVELGTNQWPNRWQDPDGGVLYTDDPNYDPNRDPNLSRTDFKRSAIRPR